MKKLVGIVVAVAALAVQGAGKTEEEIIQEGVHTYMPERYHAPTSAAVKAALERFKDKKLGLMMHFGIYTPLGIHESWPLVDEEASWSRKLVDWTDGEGLKRTYWSMNKSFNPFRFQPEVWADIAKRDGFRYVILPTKHHDGFCMYDSKFTDWKVTAKECAFPSSPNADVCRRVFDAFRARGMGAVCYFSKPDWHHPDYWDGLGLGRHTTRMPTYDVAADPARWNRFREYTRNQILELIANYGPFDSLWLDGGQVQPKFGLDIRIEEIVAEARKIQPDLLAIDRTAGNTCEDVITPEQTVPPKVLEIPWESCIPLGTGFSYRYNDTYMPLKDLVHLFIDIVAKGGNLALDIAPGPDGRFPPPVVDRLDGLGKWLKANGAAIYATRPRPPHRSGDWAFTRGKGGETYAIRLWTKPPERTLELPEGIGRFGRAVHLATGAVLPISKNSTFSFAADTWPDAVADAFRLEP